MEQPHAHASFSSHQNVRGGWCLARTLISLPPGYFILLIIRLVQEFHHPLLLKLHLCAARKVLISAQMPRSLYQCDGEKIICNSQKYINPCVIKITENKIYVLSAIGDIAALHRGTPLYGQPSWWGDGDADDENSFKQEIKTSGKKQESSGTGKITQNPLKLCLHKSLWLDSKHIRPFMLDGY